MTVGSTYRPRPTKRSRRTKAGVASIRQAIRDVVGEDHPMTVRQVFYRLVSMGAIEKTEAAYKMVVRLLGLMRRDGELPFRWIADSTRWVKKPTTHSSLEEMLESAERTYRRAIWDDQDCCVEIWLEKEALAGVIYEITSRWDVPLMVTRGYPSLSFLYGAAESIQDENRPCHLYYLGDLDPSGVDIPRKVEHDLRQFAPDAEIHFQRVAVTRNQVEEMGLQTRPTKTTDTRAKHFKGESVEVDAIPPARLRAMVWNLIEQHIDGNLLAQTKCAEGAERDTLRTIMDRLREEGGADA